MDIGCTGILYISLFTGIYLLYYKIVISKETKHIDAIRVIEHWTVNKITYVYLFV